MTRRALVAIALSLLVTPASSLRAQNTASTVPSIDRHELPGSVTFPEGSAYDPAANVLYTASAVNGVVIRVNLRTHASETVAPAGVLLPAASASPFPAVLGMRLDGSGRLWIAGGATGKMWVLDTRSGRVLKQLEVPNPTASLINDVVIVGNAAYFTDTRVPTLWRVTFQGDQIGNVEAWLGFANTPLQYGTGNNLNGIAATPDNKSLIVVQMTKGLLFKIDLTTKAVTAIDTAGADLSGADGLVLDGQTLYVVRQTAVEIATVALSADLQKGTVTNRFKDAALAWPATASKVGDRLVVVNTQFNARTDKAEKTPFWLAGVPLSRLAAGR